MQQLRSTILREEETIAGRSRFGLFSQPPPIALGDNTSYPELKANKGEDGKPITKPRQMLAGTNRTGVLKKSYIQAPSSIHQNDPFKQTFKLQIKYQNQMHTKSPIHQRDFVPTGYYKQTLKSDYQHQEEKQFPQKKPNRDESGKVKTEPSNFVTNPTFKVENKLFKHPKHMPDPFQRSEEIAKQDKKLWKSKIIHDVMFKSMSHGNNNFSKNKQQYGQDEKVKMLMKEKKNIPYGPYNQVNHDYKFKPARKGHGDPLARYPEYVKPKERVSTASRKMKTEPVNEQRNDWKHTYKGSSRPTPSISMMSSNFRKHL